MYNDDQDGDGEDLFRQVQRMSKGKFRRGELPPPGDETGERPRPRRDRDLPPWKRY